MSSTPQNMQDALIALSALTTRVEHIEREQSKMGDRQNEIITVLKGIQSTLDKAAGGATVVRWVMGFLGIGSLSGCLALMAQFSNLLHRGN